MWEKMIFIRGLIFLRHCFELFDFMISRFSIIYGGWFKYNFLVYWHHIFYTKFISTIFLTYNKMYMCNVVPRNARATECHMKITNNIRTMKLKKAMKSQHNLLQQCTHMPPTLCRYMKHSKEAIMVLTTHTLSHFSNLHQINHIQSHCPPY